MSYKHRWITSPIYAYPLYDKCHPWHKAQVSKKLASPGWRFVPNPETHADVTDLIHKFNRLRWIFWRLLVPLYGFWWSEMLVKSGGVRDYLTAHAGNAGSTPAGIPTYNIEGLRFFVSPFFVPANCRSPHHFPHETLTFGKSCEQF